jgi:hypothetical protein
MPIYIFDNFSSVKSINCLSVKLVNFYGPNLFLPSLFFMGQIPNLLFFGLFFFAK